MIGAPSHESGQAIPNHREHDPRMNKEHTKVPPRHDMRVEVENHLPAAPVDVEEEPVTRLSNSLIRSDLPCHLGHVSDERVSVGNIVQCGDMPSRHHKDVDRRGRPRVPEGNHLIVLVHLVRGQGALDYATENAVTHTNSSICRSATYSLRVCSLLAITCACR